MTTFFYNQRLNAFIYSVLSYLIATLHMWRRRLSRVLASHVRAITKELLVCRLCIILLSLYELMVKIDIIHLTLFQLARYKHTIE